MNDEQFEYQMRMIEHAYNPTVVAALRARDAAQREALARVEAERNEVCDGLDRQTARLIAAQAQLAEAVALLQNIEQRMYGEDVEHRFTDLIADIDRITAQVEQQGYCERCGCSGEISEGCGPAGCSCRGEKEAQVAQAGDEAKSFERWWTSTEILRKNKMMLAQEAWMARAALATQPAVRGAEHGQ